MSEDGGHTDDDDDDIRDDVDDIADAIDFREEAEDERRTKARTRAFMNDQLAQDDAELEKAKEVIANGYGRFDSDDRWQRRKKSNGNDESDDDMDYGPVIEVPRKLWNCLMTMTVNGASRPRNGERSRNLVHKNHFNYRMRSRVLSVKLSLRRSTGDRTRFTSNHRRLRRDHSPAPPPCQPHSRAQAVNTALQVHRCSLANPPRRFWVKSVWLQREAV